MSYPRVILTLVPMLLLGTGLTLTAQQPTKQTEVSKEIFAFLEPVKLLKEDSELVKKLKERHNAGALLLEERIKDYKKGTRDIGPVYEAASLVVGAKLDLAERPKDKIAVLEQTLEVAKLFEKFLQKQLSLGFGSKGDLERARFSRLSVEVELLKAKQKPSGSK